MNNELLEFVKNFVAKSDAKNDSLQAVQPNLNATEKLIEKSESETRAAVTQLNDGMNDGHASFETTIKQGKETRSTIETQVSEVFEVHRSTTTHLVEKLSNVETEFEKQSAETNEEINSMIDEIGNITEATDLNLSTGFETIIESMQHEKERIERNHEEIVEMKQQLEEIHQNSVDALGERIVASRNRLQTFHNEELKVYASTGNV